VKWTARSLSGPASGRIAQVPITATIREILWPRRDHHPSRVFTFVAKRTVDKVIRGKRQTYVEGVRYPITKDGFRRVWDGVRRDADLPTGGAALRRVRRSKPMFDDLGYFG
jgi:hypothetical protein